MAPVQRIGIQRVADIVQIRFDGVAAVDAVFRHQIDCGEGRRLPRWRSGVCGGLGRTEVDAATEAEFRRQLIRAPYRTAVHRRQARAVACAVTRQRGGAGCDIHHGLGHPHVRAVDFPLAVDAACHVHLKASAVALARKQQSRGCGVGVGVALIVLRRMEDCKACGELLVRTVQLGTQLNVLAALGVGVGTLRVVRVHIARGVERGAVREVVRMQRVGLVQHTKALARGRDVLRVRRGDQRAQRRGSGDGVSAVVTAHVVVAQAHQDFPILGNLNQVLRIHAKPKSRKLIARPQDACVFIHAGTIKRRAVAVLRLGDVHTTLGLSSSDIHRLFFKRKVNAGDDLVLEAQGIKLGGKITLKMRGVDVLNLQCRTPVEHGAVVQVFQGDGRWVCEWRGGRGSLPGKADRAGPLVARETALAHGSLQFAVSAETMGVLERQPLRAAVIAVTGRAKVSAGVQPAQDGVFCGGGRRVGPNPRQSVVDAVFVVQRIQAHHEFVLLANAKAIRACNAFFVDAGARAVVVRLGHHRIQAQCSTLAGLDIEVAQHTHIVVAAQGGGYFMLSNQTWHLAGLVHSAARGAPAKQHRGRAAQQLHTVDVEGVAVIKRRVTHAVNENVTRGRQREAPQANVFLATFRGLKRHASCVAQHVFDGVQVAVVNQLFGHHGDGLRNVAQLLFAFADVGFSRANGVFAFGRFSFFFDDDGLERFVCRRGCRWGLLCHGTQRARQQHGTEGQKGYRLVLIRVSHRSVAFKD